MLAVHHHTGAAFINNDVDTLLAKISVKLFQRFRDMVTAVSADQADRMEF